MNCEQASELAALAASGDVTDAERLALESHVAGCAGCRAELVALEAMCGQLAAMRSESAAEHVYLAVRSRVIAEISQRRRPRWLAAWPAFAAVAACSLILLVTLHRDLPVVNQPPERQFTALAASVHEDAPAVPASAVLRRTRRHAVRQVASVSDEPLVVHMFTSDPDVVIYWVANAKGRGSEKEIIQ